MSGWIEPFVELILEGIVSILGFVIEDRKEKSDLQQLMAQQRQEHATIVRQLATSDKPRSLRGYDLTGTCLEDIDLVAADLVEISFRDAKVFRTNFQEANLTSADFSGAQLVDVNFYRANLSQADFTGSTMKNVDLSLANLRGAQLSQVNEIIECFWNGIYINSVTELKREFNT